MHARTKGPACFVSLLVCEPERFGGAKAYGYKSFANKQVNGQSVMNHSGFTVAFSDLTQ